MNLSLGKALRIIREAQGVSMGSLATEAQLSVPYLSLLESDKRNPSIDVIGRLANALGIPVAALMLIGAAKKAKLNSADRTTNELVDLLDRFEKLERELSNAIEEAAES